MKQEKIQAVNAELLEKTGVDFSAYRNPELLDAIANAVTFPLFFARSVLRPTGILLALGILWIVLADSTPWKIFLVFPGLVLAVANGVLLGLVIFVRRIAGDMDQVFTISADLSLQVMKDISAARGKAAGGQAGLPALLDIFRGVNAIVVLPIVIQVLDRKIPFFGGLAVRLTERFFDVVQGRLGAAIKDKKDDPGGQGEALSPQQVAAWLDSAETRVDKIKGGISAVVDKVSRLVAFPFRTAFIVVLIVSAAILGAGYSLLA